MIESAEDFEKTVEGYAMALYLWGLFDLDRDVSSARDMVQACQERLEFVQDTLEQMHDWIRKSELRLIHSDDDVITTEPRGFFGPIKDDGIEGLELAVIEAFGSGEECKMEVGWRVQEPWEGEYIRAKSSLRLKEIVNSAYVELENECNES